LRLLAALAAPEPSAAVGSDADTGPADAESGPADADTGPSDAEAGPSDTGPSDTGPSESEPGLGGAAAWLCDAAPRDAVPRLGETVCGLRDALCGAESGLSLKLKTGGI